MVDYPKVKYMGEHCLIFHEWPPVGERGLIMSTPNDETMFPANEAMHETASTTERLCCQDAIAVAGDRDAMKAALQEYIVRLMFEHGDKLGRPLSRSSLEDDDQDAVKEYHEAPINRGKAHV